LRVPMRHASHLLRITYKSLVEGLDRMLVEEDCRSLRYPDFLSIFLKPDLFSITYIRDEQAAYIHSSLKGTASQAAEKH
jgi:hypothetical protein